MRLTLRTMLAYLDDILDPSDAQGLEQKIEESKFASDLVHRIRSSTRRLRLGAPKIDGKGMAEDANTVAEYLDNVKSMTAERILEFEKVCLESDVHLAEVASAHQILTHVLREPAHIEEGLRERVYRVGYGAPEAHQAIEVEDSPRHAVGPTASIAAMTSDQMTAEPPVMAGSEPAHIAAMDHRASLAPIVAARPSRTPLPLASLAVTLLLGFVLAVVALRAMGEFGPNHPVLRFFVGGRSNATIAEGPDASTQPQATAVTEGSQTNDSNKKVEPETTAETGRTDVADSASTQRPPASSNTDSSVVTEKSTTIEANTKIGSAVASSERPQTPPASEPPATSTVDASKNSIETPIVPISPPATASSTAEPKATTDFEPSIPVPPIPATPVMPITAGRFVSEEQVLALWDEQSGSWAVLPPDTALAAGDRLLSLPTFRPQIMVAPSVKLTIAGEGFLRLNAPDATNIPRVTIDWGRAALIPVGDMVSSVSIDVGGRTGRLTFSDVESAAAIDVRVFLPPGADPIETPPHLAVQLWATSGAINWEEQGRPATKLAAGQMGLFVDEEEMAVRDAMLPEWIDGSNLTDIERRASLETRRFLIPDRPLSLSLMELTNYRQVEVRSLACRSLCYLDIYEPALESFSDQQHRSYWHTHLDAIRSRIGHGEGPATKLSLAVEKLFNDQADLVMRMLVGYAPDQLSMGGAKELVEELTNSGMAIRVLAYENLRRITGKTQLFRPEERPEQEKPKVLKWRKLLEEGQIGYKDDAGR